MAKSKRLMKSRTSRMLFGVAGGIAEYFEVDPVLVRVAFVALIPLSGVGLIAYVVFAIAMPSSSKRAPTGSIETPAPAERPEGGGPSAPPPSRREAWRSPRAVLGLALVLLGLLFLLDNLGLFRFGWGQLWPLAIIGIGVLVLVASLRRP